MTRIHEKVLRGFAPQKFYSGWPTRERECHEHEMPGVCWDDRRETLVMHTHRWLVQTGKHTVLIDAGIGNDKTRKLPMFSADPTRGEASR